MKRVCITGASGFIGQSLCRTLAKSGFIVKGFIRNSKPNLQSGNNINYIPVGNIDLSTNWENLLSSQDCIIHCAGTVNATNKKNDESIYNSINVEGTKNLAMQAAKAGVKRLIFLSTIKVNGECTNDIPNKKNKFIYSDTPNPQDIYSISKLKAEKALWEISNKTGLEIVILRLGVWKVCKRKFTTIDKIN